MLVNNAIEELQLIRSWDNFNVDFTHYYEVLGTTYVSVLDHFILNESLNEYIVSAGVIHHSDNLSDHCPIYCVVNLPDIHEQKSIPTQNIPKPSWSKAEQHQRDFFQLHLDECVRNINIPYSLITCNDALCSNPSHINDIDVYTLEVLQTLQFSAEECLPMSSNGNLGTKAKKSPGWKDMVKEYKDTAYFWHQIWISCGRPINNEIHNIMKSTRNRYHYEYKKCLKLEEKVKKSKLLDSCLNGEGDLFKEIKAMRNVAPPVATSMDGVTENVKEYLRD